ncbi:MAG: PhoH family protein [Planctomycetes bacterium]|nr:PhoH family protein [Planctomycetota bacterium]
MNTDEERALLGRQDRTLRLLRDSLGVRIVARRGLVQLDGDGAAVREGMRVIGELLTKVRAQGDLTDEEVETFLYEQRGGRDGPKLKAPPMDRVAKTLDESPVVPRTPGQARYIECVMKHDIVLGIGPAGTGKTYLAVAMAVRMMRQGLYRRLVLVRPAVEAGEKLGFLPGDLNAKVSPYVRPLYDAIGDFVEFVEIKRYMDRDIIEVAPLAYMRGRTLDHAFIILDEGQNTTRSQMQMFLTRMGRKSKIVVTGDVTQIDLPRGVTSGLVDAVERLKNVEGIGICELARGDIVRHPLVQKIVDAYGDETSGTQPRTDGRSG